MCFVLLTMRGVLLCAQEPPGPLPRVRVQIAAIAAPLLDIQVTKGRLLEVVPRGDAIPLEALSPVLCMVILHNTSAVGVAIHSPVRDPLGYRAVAMEYVSGGDVFRRVRVSGGGRRCMDGDVIPGYGRLSVLQELAPQEAIAIPIPVADFWPQELGHIYRAQSNTMVRAIVTIADSLDVTQRYEVSSPYVSLGTLLVDRISRYLLPVTVVTNGVPPVSDGTCVIRLETANGEVGGARTGESVSNAVTGRSGVAVSPQAP